MSQNGAPDDIPEKKPPEIAPEEGAGAALPDPAPPQDAGSEARIGAGSGESAPEDIIAPDESVARSPLEAEPLDNEPLETEPFETEPYETGTFETGPREPPTLEEQPPRYFAPAPEDDLPNEEPPAWAAPIRDIRPSDRDDLFGEPEIVFPGESARTEQHLHDAQLNLDLDLGRIKRKKRYGLFSTIIGVLFIALVLAPVTWVGIYRVIEAPGTVLMVTRASEGQHIRHTPVKLTQMSPHIIRAVIAAEDANFCTHHGFDVEAIQDALESNQRGGRVRGGSTISQQTAKNLFLWSSRSWVRKGLETYFTSLVEFMWPKDRIMEAYLNAAEWGDGIFGIEAAAQARFGVSAAQLSPLQAARLAAVLPSPNRWRADSPGPYVRRRAASIVERARVIQNEHLAGCVLALDRAP